MPLKAVKDLGLHLLEALAAAEAVRIVHRDVKPENVMCDSSGEYCLGGHPKPATDGHLKTGHQ